MKLQFVALFSIISLGAVQGAGYEFVIEKEEIFETCPEYPDTIGLVQAFDMSDMTFIYSEGSVKVTGNLTCKWEGVQPTDRIEIRADLYKFQRGTWQPTLLSTVRPNYCTIFFDKNSITYQMWTSNIAEEDQLCFNHYGHVYHHRPFNVDTVIEFAANMAGRHKIVAQMTAYDNKNVKRDNPICFQIFGEYVKVK